MSATVLVLGAAWVVGFATALATVLTANKRKVSRPVCTIDFLWHMGREPKKHERKESTP